MSLTSPEEILRVVRGVHSDLIAELEKASRGPRGGRLPRGCPVLRTEAEGLAWVQGRIDRDFLLPPLDFYFATMRMLGMKNIPAWKGEPEDELAWLETADSIVACCEQAISRAAQEFPVIWYHGEKSYSTDRVKPLKVSQEQHNILQAFLDKSIALDTLNLSNFGVNNVADVIGKIIKKFGEGAIRRPANKGDGYFLNVQSLKT